MFFGRGGAITRWSLHSRGRPIIHLPSDLRPYNSRQTHSSSSILNSQSGIWKTSLAQHARNNKRNGTSCNSGRESAQRRCRCYSTASERNERVEKDDAHVAVDEYGGTKRIKQNTINSGQSISDLKVSHTADEYLKDEVDRQMDLDESLTEELSQQDQKHLDPAQSDGAEEALDTTTSKRSSQLAASPEELSFGEPTFNTEHRTTKPLTSSNLPKYCHGCGAPAHTDRPGEAGFFNTQKVGKKMSGKPAKADYVERKQRESEIYRQVMANLDPKVLEQIMANNSRAAENEPEEDLSASNDSIGMEDELLMKETDDILVEDFSKGQDTGVDTSLLTTMDEAESKSEVGASSREALEGNDATTITEFTAAETATAGVNESPADGNIAESVLGEYDNTVNGFPQKQILPRNICERCHSLLGNKMEFASLPPATFEQIVKPIADCPFRNVHIYHVIDAADFPMSFVPNVMKTVSRLLEKMQVKGQPRKRISISYVITRADLLLPQIGMVTSLMTYLRTVLKESTGEDVNLKDLRIVSAKRTWTTEQIKEDLRDRQGGVFLLGRTNVGKSRLFESIFPKQRKNDPKPDSRAFGRGDGVEKEGLAWVDGYVQNGEKVQYPEMPVVSKVPGTTAAPVVIDFAKGRGQLVDLPGVRRGPLLDFVKDDKIRRTVLVDRIIPEMRTVRVGQSLILGGLVRLTSATEGAVLLTYPFTALTPYVTSAPKLDKYMRSDDFDGIIRKPGVEDDITSAGIFELKTDVTKKRNPKLRNMSQEEIEKLPYRIWAVDILIEGCGWVEIVAQMRRGQLPPSVQVFSPLGRGIGSRVTMGIEMMGRRKVERVAPGSRPKRSMKGAKKLLKKQEAAVTHTT